MLRCENIPYVVREKGITQTPIDVIARQGAVRYERIFSKFGRQGTAGAETTPVVFIDVRDIPITFHRLHGELSDQADEKSTGQKASRLLIEMHLSKAYITPQQYRETRGL